MFSNFYLWYGVVSNGFESICIYGVHLRILGQCWTRPKDRLGSWTEVAPIFRARSGLRMIKLIVLELNWRFVANA